MRPHEPVPGILEDRVAIVTGAAGGLGTSISDALEREGAKVVRADIADAQCVSVDVRDLDANYRLVDLVMDRYGRLDVLVLNAGVQFTSPIPDFPEEEWDRLMDVMVKGSFNGMKAAWPALTAQQGGRIIFTASGASFRGVRNKVAYVAAKHAVVGLMRVAALEGAPSGTTSNAVAPGWMETPMVEAQIQSRMKQEGQERQDVVAALLAAHPVDKFVDTRDVARVVAFLASEWSAGISGACIPVDFGALAQ